MDVRMRDYLLADFKKSKGAQLSRDPAIDARAKAKLLKEAQKVKTVLSANTETLAQVEGVFEDKDFKASVSREQLHELGADVFARVQGPVTAALSAANLTMADIRSLIVVGGSVRCVPPFFSSFLGVRSWPKGLVAGWHCFSANHTHAKQHMHTHTHTCAHMLTARFALVLGFDFPPAGSPRCKTRCFS